jgi:hypothetical protein
VVDPTDQPTQRLARLGFVDQPAVAGGTPVEVRAIAILPATARARGTDTR